MLSIGRIDSAVRDGLGAYMAARLSDQRGADLSEWALLGSTIARICRDAADRRRRLWRMKLPAIVAAVAVWVLLLRDHVPEDRRSTYEVALFLICVLASSVWPLVRRWRLDSRIARSRKAIAYPVDRQLNGFTTSFAPAHVITVDGSTVAAIDRERRLIRVIAPVFSDFDVVFAVDARIRRVRLARPIMMDLPAVAGMPKTSSDVQHVSALTVEVDGAAEAALFLVAAADVAAAIEWTNVFQQWMQEDAAWQRNVTSPAFTL